jgi:hypothetical protein
MALVPYRNVFFVNWVAGEIDPLDQFSLALVTA